MKPTVLEWMIIVTTTLIMVVLLYGQYRDSNSPTMGINKAEWKCVKSEDRTHLQLIGKIWTPFTTTVCVEYGRIGTGK